ncbi:MAG: VPLPA-CTERM sorting domain-containing protein [Pseudomonadota bacterium]
MKTTFKKSLLTTSVLASLYGTSTVHAMTVDESTIMGGDFSNNFIMPTILAPGTTGISGNISAGMNSDGSFFGDADIVRFIDLPTGKQTFNVKFTYLEDTLDPFFSVFEFDGLNNVQPGILQFGFEGDGDGSAGEMLLFSFDTPDDFSGMLNVNFFTEGDGSIDYSIELQPVPVPAAALLFASGLGALGAAKARRKAKRRS